MFSFQPQQQQQQQQQLPMMANTTIAPQPYPRDTPFHALPVEIRNALESLERTVMSHTISARRLADQVSTADRQEQVEATRRGVFEGMERVGRLVQRQQAAKVNIQNCRRLTGQYWRYGESVAAVLSSCPTFSIATAPQSGQQQQPQQQKYANLQLPPYDLQLFERIVDRLDGLVEEAEQAATNLRDELEHRTQPRPTTMGVLAKAAVNAQVAVREARERVNGVAVEAEEDCRAYRRFLVKYKSDSTDPFPPKRRHY